MSCLLLSLAMVLGSFDAPTQSGFSVAINVAGKQRMLSQKMTKEYLLYALQIDGDKNLANAKATIAQFEENAKVLANGDKERNLPAPPNQAIREQLAKVATQWTALRGELDHGIAEPASVRTNLASVQKLSATVLDEMNKAVSLYEEACKAAGFTSSGTVVNIAGRQRMLSQKMAKEVCFLALGIDVEGQRASLSKSRELFARSLTGLIEGDAELGLPPLKSDSIRRQLGKVQELWKSFEPLLDQAAGGSSVAPDLLRQVAELNPQLLNEMNKAVTMFEGTPAQ